MNQSNSSPVGPTFTLKFLIANCIGVALYLYGASFGWVEPELQDVPGAAGGGAVVWGMFAIPVFLAFLLGNLVSLCWVCLRRLRAGIWAVSAWGLLVLPLWICAIWLDFSRHGI